MLNTLQTTNAALALWKSLGPIRSRRERKGWPLLKLAEKAGVHWRTLRKAEGVSGRYETPLTCSAKTFHKIGKQLGVDGMQLHLETVTWFEDKPNADSARDYLDKLADS